MIGSVPEEICDMDQGAGPRAIKLGSRHRRNALAIPLELSPDALGAADLSSDGPLLNQSTLF